MIPAGTRPPACSIVLATLAGWEDVRDVVTELARQAAPGGGEVIVADGSTAAPPPDGALPAQVSWLTMAGAGTFDLREAALRRAAGEVVVITEDHCLPPPGWCARLLELHARHPDADVVQGRVENASRHRAIDWAGFLVNQSPHLPPIDPIEATRQLAIVGVSLKRRTLDRLLSSHPEGPPELIPTAALRALGLRVRIDESLCVAHVQSESWLGHAALHFHNARAIAGRRRRSMTRRDWTRVIAAPALPPYRAARVVVRALRKRLPPGLVLRAAPGIAWLYGWKSLGECVGYFAGPGDSARRLH